MGAWIGIRQPLRPRSPGSAFVHFPGRVQAHPAGGHRPDGAIGALASKTCRHPLAADAVLAVGAGATLPVAPPLGMVDRAASLPCRCRPCGSRGNECHFAKSKATGSRFGEKTSIGPPPPEAVPGAFLPAVARPKGQGYGRPSDPPGYGWPEASGTATPHSRPFPRASGVCFAKSRAAGVWRTCPDKTRRSLSERRRQSMRPAGQKQLGCGICRQRSRHDADAVPEGREAQCRITATRRCMRVAFGPLPAGAWPAGRNYDPNRVASLSAARKRHRGSRARRSRIRAGRRPVGPDAGSAFPAPRQAGSRRRFWAFTGTECGNSWL